MLRGIEKKLLFVIEGNILGLSNDGKIALHNTGDLIKKCPDTTDNHANSSITVMIRNAENGELLARYLAVRTEQKLLKPKN